MFYHKTELSKSERLFMFLATIFIASLVLTNIIAGKYFVCFGLPLSCSALVYPFTFLVTDIVSEIYGAKYARLLVVAGFVVSMVTTALIWIATQLPIDPSSPIDQPTFGQTLGFLPGIVIASMIAYLIAQFVDVQVFAYIRKWTAEKHLWLRNNASTLLSQMLDTLIVVTIALIIWPKFDGNPNTRAIDLEVWKQIILGQYLFKAVLTLLETPFVYMGVYFLRRWTRLETR
jgi:uncharacterized integral membrane protein (TIGR00697 family)